MHASSWIFVFVNDGSSFQAAPESRYLNRSSITMIMWLVFCGSLAFGQSTYLGKWNSSRDWMETARARRFNDAHDRTLKPSKAFQDHQLDNANPRSIGWQLPLASSNPTETQPKSGLNPANLPLLIPESPTEESFTASESIVEAVQMIDPDSDKLAHPASNQHTDSLGASYPQATNHGRADHLEASHSAVSPDKVSPDKVSPEQVSPEQVSRPNTFSPAQLSPGEVSHPGLVQAASFEEPFKSPSTFNGSGDGGSSVEGTSLDLARRWIDQYLVGSHSNSAGLNFRPVSLIELLRQPAAINQRLEMVDQYWETWNQWAETNSRIQFANWINNINVSGSQADVQLLTTWKSQSQNQIFEAKTLLSNAQSRLESFLLPLSSASGAAHFPPLPSDNPLIHPYVTNYQLYQKHRSLPDKFRNIDRELKDNLNQIVRQTQMVESAKFAAASQLNLYQGGRENFSSVIAAGQTWRLAEMNLVQTVAIYNQKIADYALNVAEGSYSPETVSAMLIGKSGNKRSKVEPAIISDSNARPPLPATQPKNGLVSQNVQAGAPQSVLENGSDSERPNSSSLSRMGNQPSSDATSRDGVKIPLRENAAVTQSNIQLIQGGSAPNMPSDPLNRSGARPSSDRTTGNAAADQLGDLSPRSVPDQNDVGGMDSNRSSSGNAANAFAQPFRVPSSGTSGDFNSSSSSPNPNATNPSFGSPRSAQFNPLTPMSNSSSSSASQSGSSELPVGKSTNPERGSFDRIKSSGGSFNPAGDQRPPINGLTNPVEGWFNPGAANPGAANPGAANPGGTNPGGTNPGGTNPGGTNPGGTNPGGASNPANGMFSPPEFNPPGRPIVPEAKRSSPLDSNDLPVDTPESGARPILPPENDGQAGSKILDSSFD